MKTSNFDIAIVGSGPIGASTAYHLKDGGKSVAIVTAEPLSEDPEHLNTYRYAGGSVRWFFENEEISTNTRKTADLVLSLVSKGIDLSLVEDSYVFLNRGLRAPSLNISGAKLVDHLLNTALIDPKIQIFKNCRLQSFKKNGEKYLLQTSGGEITAARVLLALGSQLNLFVPEAQFEFEKRETLVLNLPVDENRVSFPHLVMPFQNGIIYIFIKETPRGKKMLLSHEDVIHSEGAMGVDYLSELKKLGITKILPFLEKAETEEVLWGFDAKNKQPKIYSPDEKLFAVACGSAVRSCVGIGETVSGRLVGKEEFGMKNLEL